MVDDEIQQNRDAEIQRAEKDQPSNIIIGCSKCKSDKLIFLETTTRSIGDKLLFFNSGKCPDCGDRGYSFSVLENIALAKRYDSPFFYLCASCGQAEFIDRIDSKEKLSTDTELQLFHAKCSNCGKSISIRNYFGADFKKIGTYWYDFTLENFNNGKKD